MPTVINNFSEIAHKYKAIFCDLWGCIHNGKKSYKESLEALCSFKKQGGHVILLTNAPRTRETILQFLKKLGISKEFYDEIVTSGDATQFGLKSGNFGNNFYHIGPKHDRSVFGLEYKFKPNGQNMNLVLISEASCIVCTGLFDDRTETPDDYENIINEGLKRDLPLLCANPDIQVDYGHQRLWCAGAIAENYSKAGGQSVYFGKPYKPIYDLAISKLHKINPSITKSEIICVGDGIATDILGGTNYSLDTLFVASGLAYKATGIVNGATTPNNSKLNDFFEKNKITPSISIGYFR